MYDRRYTTKHICWLVDRLQRYIRDYRYFDNRCRVTHNELWVYWAQRNQYDNRAHQCIKNLMSDLNSLL